LKTNSSLFGLFLNNNNFKILFFRLIFTLNKHLLNYRQKFKMSTLFKLKQKFQGATTSSLAPKPSLTSFVIIFVMEGIFQK